ncbi:type II toxin-antitoxin system YoeB family toxin [Chryseobacterium sp. FH1]|uniref:type II toxin-antitoxin system YoeB family toxin n=1 Tax=Chryseobacterium sp. FH1 TaxID=1233951 RepID=UPI000A6B50A4|nr:type II toxin-antitoxin system YoeB family toxin [Chryseobacterium sp. FH1]
MEKVQTFLIELEEHPRTGAGSPEQLKYYHGEVWSREVNKKDRFVYEIFEEEEEVSVTLIQSLDHYDDE